MEHDPNESNDAKEPAHGGSFRPEDGAGRPLSEEEIERERIKKELEERRRQREERNWEKGLDEPEKF